MVDVDGDLIVASGPKQQSYEAMQPAQNPRGIGNFWDTERPGRQFNE
jgi:hypothetical protein